MDTRSHIIHGMQGEAMRLLDDVLPSGVNQKFFNAKLTPSALQPNANIA